MMTGMVFGGVISILNINFFNVTKKCQEGIKIIKELSAMI
jgi:hypothetical protein